MLTCSCHQHHQHYHHRRLRSSSGSSIVVFVLFVLIYEYIICVVFFSLFLSLCILFIKHSVLNYVLGKCVKISLVCFSCNAFYIYLYFIYIFFKYENKGRWMCVVRALHERCAIYTKGSE